jgi:hypothetical protein
MELSKDRNLKVAHLGESGDASSYTIEVTAGSNNSSPTNGSKTDVLISAERSFTITNSCRGLTVVIIDHDGELIDSLCFDVYGSDSARNSLAGCLGKIMEGGYGEKVIFTLSSYDAIGSNATLAEAMRNIRANHWFHFGGNGPTHRHPYAAIGTSTLGIIKEVLHTNTVGAEQSICSMHVSGNWGAIGSEGYGMDLMYGAGMKEMSYTGTGYSFNHGPHHTITSNGSGQILEEEYLRMRGQHKVSLDRKEAGGSVTSYIWSASDTNGWINSASSSSTSIEWEEFEFYFKVQDVSNRKYIRYGHYHMPNSIDVGTSYVRNVTIQKCGFDPNRDRSQTLKGHDSFDGRTLVESTAAFGITNPDNYWTVFHSDRNLTGRPNLRDSRHGSGFDTNNVSWFNRELTERHQYSIHEGKNFSGDSNRYSDIGYVNVDSDKMYAAMIWMNNLQKDDTGGRNYVGTHTRSGGSQVPTFAYSGTNSTTNPYCMYPAGSNIEKNKWSLCTYFFLPHWFTDTQGIDFYNDHWCRWAGNYENSSADNNQKTAGSRSGNGGNIRVSRFQEGDDQIHLRWLDYYNTSTINGGEHKTWWALPMIVEIDPMDLGANGTINAFNFTETDEHLKY